MKANSNSETFHGVVKYASGYKGCVKWKSGSIIFDKNEEHGWHIKMKYSCSDISVLNLQLNRETLSKFVCKDCVFIDVKRDKDLVSIYLKPEDKKAAKHIEELLQEVKRKKVNVEKSNEIIPCEEPGPSTGVMEANKVYKKQTESGKAAKRKVQSLGCTQERLLEIEEKKLKIEEEKLQIEKEKVDILRTMSENLSKVCNSKLLNCSAKYITKK